MEENYGIKELYDVTIRARQPLEIYGKKFDINESLLTFSRVDIGILNEQRVYTQAMGGYHNIPLINWETDKEVSFSITNGVLSPISWALLTNSKVIKKNIQSINYIEKVIATCDENYSFVDLKYMPNATLGKMGIQGNPNNEPLPMGRRKELELKPLPPSHIKWIFCYDEKGNKIHDFSIRGNRIYFDQDYSYIYCDYTFDFCDDCKVIEVGDRLMNGFYSLSGKFSAKAYKNGDVTTGIINIPKIKINNSLSMRLGTDVDCSVVSDFNFVGYNDDEVRRDKRKTFEIMFLNGELTGDYNE